MPGWWDRRVLSKKTGEKPGSLPIFPLRFTVSNIFNYYPYLEQELGFLQLEHCIQYNTRQKFYPGSTSHLHGYEQDIGFSCTSVVYQNLSVGKFHQYKSLDRDSRKLAQFRSLT